MLTDSDTNKNDNRKRKKSLDFDFDSNDEEESNRKRKRSLDFNSDDEEKGNRERKSTSDNDDSDQESDDEKFIDLKQYFTSTEWKELDDYEKNFNLSLLKNYKSMVAYAKKENKPTKNISKPFFMEPKPSTNKVVCEKTQASRKRDKEKVEKAKSRKNKDKIEQASGKNKENNPNSSVSQSTRRVPFVKKKKISAVSCYGPNDMPESEYLETLREYDVEAVLEDAGDKLEKVRKELQTKGIVYGNDRKLLIRTLTRYLMFESVKDHKEITQLHKEGLAASICKAWPQFQDESATKYSWHMLFYRKKNSGFIANCVQNIYRSFDSSEKRRPRKAKISEKPSSVNAGASTSDDAFDPFKEHRWLSLKQANKHTRDDILDGMEETFPARRNWITQKKPSVTEILQAYVHFESMAGEVIDREFSLMYPGKSSCLLKGFDVLSANVKKIFTLKEIEGLNCEDLQVLVAIAENLPKPNVLRRKGRSQEPTKAKIEELIVTFPRGTSFKSVIESKRKEAKGKPVQPYLLAYVPEETITNLWIVCDSATIEIGSTFLKGLDLLFKAYFIFNVEYPHAWTYVFQFIENGIFKLDEEALFNNGRELLRRLSSA
ncbi:Zinc finger protein 282 [Frankliniella fusca]|uniref:Zinc finger protein 282 n=1 Tax=Frankliniella fusca TaxID=407009 RepID=A0AAE1LMW8_9NEOP|nr:Zinc finger protein 282 [Frankliniella fusca]